MKQSQIFTKTRKEAPKDEVSKNAQLLIRAGYVSKSMAGVYDWLPFGLRSINKISNIIRKHMNALGASEILMASLQEKNIWEKTGRWSDEVIDNWFKTSLKNGTELGLGFTHEEAITSIMKNHINSYRDLPIAAYQIQTKFRNELRAKSGVMRGREFAMKDMYSFNTSVESHNAFYEQAKQAYVNIFKELGIGDITYVTFASGGVFSKYSHEFQTVTDAGEDIVYVDEKKGIAINKEVYTDEVCAELGVKKDEMIEKKTIETGNIFSLGTRFSEALELFFVDEKGERQPVVMGSYGIGPARILGALCEIFSDEKGIVLPAVVAPYQVHLVSLGVSDAVTEESVKLYQALLNRGVEVLWDDRNLRPGEKLADSDLIGIPYRIVIGEKSLAKNEAEVVVRKSGEVKTIPLEEVVSKIVEML